MNTHSISRFLMATGLLLGLSWGTLCSAMCTPAAAESTLYKAAKVYTMTGEPISPGYVLVTDGKIAAVGANVQAPNGAKSVDLGNACLLPGFVDAYTQTGLAGGTDEFTSETTADFCPKLAIDWQDREFFIALTQGTTTLAICPGTENVIAGCSCVAKTVGNSLLREDAALVISMCSDPARRNGSRARPDGIYNRQPTNRMGVVWILRSTFDKVRRSREVESRELLESALSGQRPLMAVARTSYDIQALLNVGEEFDFAPPVIVGGQEAYKIAGPLAASGIPVILGPQTTGSDSGPEQTELAWNQPSQLSKAGITFAFSGGNLLEQARFAHRFGLDGNLALQAITKTPAELLKVADRVGAIAPGMDADLVAVDGDDPLAFTSKIRFVMVNGQVFAQ